MDNLTDEVIEGLQIPKELVELDVNLAGRMLATQLAQLLQAQDLIQQVVSQIREQLKQ